ncbi:MAG TPA: integrin alpha, partial [Polyangiales bacterium]|nr:integrin alpha [Polyangiales bacterium]
MAKSRAAAAKPAAGAKVDVPSGWIAQVSQRIQAGRYALRSEGGVLEASNHAHALEVRFQASGAVSVAFDRAAAVAEEQARELAAARQPFADPTGAATAPPPAAATKPAAEAELSVQTVALARGDQRIEATATAFALGRCRQDGEVDETGQCLKRAELAQPGWVEWWENRPNGLEQGYDVAAAPFADDASAPLRVELRVTGARVELDGDGQGATFALGREQLRYDTLSAFDADGKGLPIQLVASADGLAIEVDERGARYPIAIDPLVSSASWVVEGGQDAARVGSAVAAAGDVNGDGFGDVIVGAYLYDGPLVDEGRVWIYHGSATGLGTTAARTLELNVAGAWFGYSVASAGDVNNDGYADVIVGAPHGSDGEVNEGQAFIYTGSSGGIGATPARVLDSDQAQANFGISVASAGLVNNDLYGDVVVGAFNYSSGQTGEGAAFVYHGSATGIPATIAQTLQSNVAGAAFGWSVAGAGDVNGDGYGDLVIGAINYSNGQTNEGAAFVFHGSSTGIPSNTPAAILQTNQA